MANGKLWTDVCLKNAVVFLAACTGMGVDPEVVWRAIEKALGRSIERAKTALAKLWVSLTEYQVVEDALVEEMGHAAHLVEVGRYSAETSYGGSKAVENLIKLLRWLGGLLMRLISPRVGVHEVDKGCRAFVHNKRFQVVAEGHDYAIFRVEYIASRDGETRIATEDQRSLLGHIRGVLEAIAMLWPKSQRIKVLTSLPDGSVVTRWVGDVRYLTIDIHPADILAKEWPTAKLEIQADGNMFISGAPFDRQSYGKVVHLQRDSETGEFLDRNFQMEPGDDTVSAILITRDVCTPCKRTGRLLPIMRAGEIFRSTTPLRNLILLRWRSTWLNRLVERLLLPKISARLQNDMTQEADLAELRASDATTRREQERLKADLSEHYPNDKIRDQVVLGRFSAGSRLTVALQFDLCEFTTATSRMAAEPGAAWVDVVMNDARRIIREHGGWVYKTTGDCVVAIFTPGFHSRGEHCGPAECALYACLVAGELIRMGKNHGWEMRIGIHSGDVFWRKQSASLEGHGEPLNVASRLEHEYGKPGHVMVSGEVLKLLYPQLDFVGLKAGQTVDGDWVFEGIRTLRGCPNVYAFSKQIVGSVASSDSSASHLRLIQGEKGRMEDH